MIELPQGEASGATEVGSYFVANYPPFSAWSAGEVSRAEAVLRGEGGVGHRLKTGGTDHGLETRATETDGTGARGTGHRLEAGATIGAPLGLYLHIPFCRKRCKFCYFRVYTDKNANDVDVYLDALAREAAIYSERAGLAGRQFEFVYFGGGTPSFLSEKQLMRLIERINQRWTWSAAREVTFECEPGTLQKHKLEAIRGIGVSRLSLGIEHFDDEILSSNGRAHESPEIYRAYGWAREVGFPQINVDLIAGMVGETDGKWKRAVEETLKLEPDSVTIYQMELPHNTVISREAKASGAASPVASWAQKRAWVEYAFGQFEAAGYFVSSAYTLVRGKRGNGECRIANSELKRAGGETEGAGERSQFVYRDSLWHGADMIGMGVASFSHFAGVHYQNADQWEGYVEPLLRGELPLARAMAISRRQRLIREMVLQLKTGRLEPGYFRGKFGVEIVEEFGEAFESLRGEGFAEVGAEEVRLTRAGLLRVDELLPRFFEKTYQSVRYT